MNSRVAHSVSLRRLVMAALFAAVLGVASQALAGDYRYRWSAISSEELVEHFRKLVRIHDANGRVHIGMLVDLLGRQARLQRARSDGGGVVRVDLGEVRSVEVFDPFPD